MNTPEQFSRTTMLLGDEALERLQNARVIIFGVGGVGGYVAEALARVGIGSLSLVDSDTVAESNINRQIIALHSTLGQLKVDAARSRLKDINPELHIDTYPMFYLPQTADIIHLQDYDYVVDAVDTLTAKLEIVMRAKAAGVPVISAMGAGNKLDPTQLRLSDISKTSVCPLARAMRRELRKRGIEHLKVAYSTEPALKPLSPASEAESAAGRRSTPGSLSFVPSVMGLIIGGEVALDIAFNRLSAFMQGQSEVNEV